jgi:hypothetical protein
VATAGRARSACARRKPRATPRRAADARAVRERRFQGESTCDQLLLGQKSSTATRRSLEHLCLSRCRRKRGSGNGVLWEAAGRCSSSRLSRPRSSGRSDATGCFGKLREARRRGAAPPPASHGPARRGAQTRRGASGSCGRPGDGALLLFPSLTAPLVGALRRDRVLREAAGSSGRPGDGALLPLPSLTAPLVGALRRDGVLREAAGSSGRPGDGALPPLPSLTAPLVRALRRAGCGGLAKGGRACSRRCPSRRRQPASRRRALAPVAPALTKYSAE